MNLGELRTATNRRSGVLYDDAALDDLINEAVQRIALEAEWPWLHALYEFTATDDDGTQALPDGARRVSSVNLGGYEAFVTSIENLDAWDNVYVTSRHGYAVRGTDLLFRPTQPAGTTITVRYIRSEPRLTGERDTPLLPDVYHDAVVNLACAIANERVGNFKRAEQFDRRYTDWLRTMKANALRVGGRTGRIRVRPGGGI